MVLLFLIFMFPIDSHILMMQSNSCSIKLRVQFYYTFIKNYVSSKYYLIVKWRVVNESINYAILLL